jgi:hypothetical protein
VSFVVNTTEPPGSQFCYSVVAHVADPNENPGALCCQFEKELCLELPDCDPCDDLGVISAKPLSPNDSPDDCCYQITLFNEVSEPTLTGLELCVINGVADLTAYTTLGGDWTASTSVGGQSVTLTPVSGTLPQGPFELPPLCLGDVEQPYTQVVLKWLTKDSVICRDTLELFCDPACGYLDTKEIACQDGAYVWTGQFFNTSGFTMGGAYIQFDPSSGLSAYDQAIPFTSPVPDGGLIPVDFAIGPPAGPGDTICFTVTLHQLDDDEFHLNCCQFEACIVLPDCSIEECSCDEKFFAKINEGFSSDLTSNPASVLLNPVATFSSCDEVSWFVRASPGPFTLVGTGYQFNYTFPSNGNYRICMEVTRTEPNEETCTERSCRNFQIESATGGVIVFPNPADAQLRVLVEEDLQQPILSGWSFELMGVHGTRVAHWPAGQVQPDRYAGTYSLDLPHLPPGVYWLRGTSGNLQWTRRVFIYR